MTDKNNDNGRTLNEAEARGAATFLYAALQYGRVTIADWCVRKHRPTVDELMALAMELKGYEEQFMRVANLPPTDGHSLDGMIDHLAVKTEKISGEEA